MVLLASILAPVAHAQCTLATDADGVVINELLPNPDGVDGGQEWVEILNTSGGEVDLEGWQIAAGTSVFSTSDPLPATTLPDGDRVVVGQSALSEVDLVVSGFVLPNAGSNADAVQLRDCEGTAVDTVVYGSPNTDGWLDDDLAVATSLAPVPGSGASLARLPDGVDTDDSGADFDVLLVPTPMEANDGPELDCGGPASGIRINELLPDPEGADAGGEWVELFHAGTAPVDLTGWVLQAGTSAFATMAELPSSVLAPGELLLVGGEQVATADVVADVSLGNATSSSDGVRIVDCAGVVVDTVIYGAPNDGETPFVDDTGAVATSLAVAPGEASSLQRLSDGWDTDQSGSDFVVAAEPTPGLSNPPIEPIVCTPDQGSVTVNEILPDPDGEDAGSEFVELFNAADVEASVEGWMLSAATQDFDSIDVVLPQGSRIPPRGFLVVGGAEVASADVVAAFSLGNGTDTDGLRLLDCDGAVVDTVVYGDSPNADGIVDDRGEVVEPYGDPGSADVLARVEDGLDTDMASDWAVKARATPGESNVPEPGMGVVVEEPRGCAARSEPRDVQSPRDVDDPTSAAVACDQSPVGGSSLALWLAAVAVARRRRVHR
ncbi:MAG: lamin tail domain-containing protein [Myxococcales bacterium]|nr:lamin tail domain-containing protein [Myxococcales bacterium]